MNERQSDLTGSVQVLRSLAQSDEWLAHPFDVPRRMLDLFLLARTEPGKVTLRSKRGTPRAVELKRGQLCWSVRSLAERWKIGRTQAGSYLNYLVKMGTIFIEPMGEDLHVITVTNYTIYNPLPSHNRATIEPQSSRNQAGVVPESSTKGKGKGKKRVLRQRIMGVFWLPGMVVR